MGITKLAALTAVTEEMIRFGNVSAELMIRDDLRDAIIQQMDSDFINPASAGVANVQPAAISNSVGAGNTRASGGDTAADVRADLQAMANGFSAQRIRMSDVVIVLSEELKTALRLFRNSLGQKEFPEVADGELEGFSYIASDSVPAATVVGVSASSIYLADDGGVDIRVSTEASLEMDDAPAQSAITAVAGASMVSMFQTESVAIKATRFANWLRARDGSVQVVTAATWNGAPSA
jgi:HK97 family phage major capsid protein